MQAPTRYEVCGSNVRPHSSINSPFAILVIQVSTATLGYCSFKNSKTVFQRPGGSHRELGPTPATVGSGAFIVFNIAFRIGGASLPRNHGRSQMRHNAFSVKQGTGEHRSQSGFLQTSDSSLLADQLRGRPIELMRTRGAHGPLQVKSCDQVTGIG